MLLTTYWGWGIIACAILLGVIAKYTKAPKLVKTMRVPNTMFWVGDLKTALDAPNRAPLNLLEWSTMCNFTHVGMSIPGQRLYVTFHVPDAQHILYTNFENYPKGKHFFECFQDLLGVGIFGADGELWRMQRKAASHLFSASQLRSRMQSAFNEHLIALHQRLDKEIARSTAMGVPAQVDWQKLAFSFTFDSICKIAFGAHVNSLAEDATSLAFQEAYDFCNETSLRRHFVPELLWRLEKFFGIGVEGEMKEKLAYVNAYVLEIVRRRRAELEASQESLQTQEPTTFARGISQFDDVLSLYMKYAQKALTDYSDQFLRDVVINFIIAGRDTTACAMTWMMMLVCQHPEIEAKILKELEELEAPEPVPYDLVPKLVWTSAFFFEACRLFPPVFVDQKICVARDKLPSGIELEPGDRIAYAIIGMNRNPAYWERPNEVLLERWVEQDPVSGAEVLKEFDANIYPTFNIRPRLCLGKNMAQFEAVAVFASILRRYRFQLATDMSTPQYSGTVTLSSKIGMPVIVSRREPAANVAHV